MSDTLFNGDPVEVINERDQPIPVIPFTNKTPFTLLLSSNGDGTGTTNAKGNYSVGSPGVFYLQPPSNEIWCINSLSILITDDGIIDAGAYGDGLVLANGYLLQIKSSATVLLDLAAGSPIKTNPDWGRLGGDAYLLDWGTGNDALSIILHFCELFGLPLRLNGANNERIQFTCQDNTSGLVSQYLQAMGYKE